MGLRQTARPLRPEPPIHLIHKTSKMKANQVNIKNRRATFDYEIGETFTAGMVLTGTEIKSIRAGKASLSDSYCLVDRGEVWVKGMNISEYFYGSYNNHTARRDRKLLLSRKEIARIIKLTEAPGYTIVPLRVFISERGYAKLVIGVGRGKKQYDKRQTLRDRDDRRMLDRLMKK